MKNIKLFEAPRYGQIEAMEYNCNIRGIKIRKVTSWGLKNLFENPKKDLAKIGQLIVLYGQHTTKEEMVVLHELSTEFEINVAIFGIPDFLKKEKSLESFIENV